MNDDCVEELRKLLPCHLKGGALMQQHAYSRTSAMFSIFLPALLICVFFLWSLYTLMSAGPEPLAVLGVYTLPFLMLSSITGLNQPTNIMISEDELKIGAFGRWHNCGGKPHTNAFVTRRFTLSAGMPIFALSAC